MTEKLVALQVRLAKTLEDREAGQGTLEYVGMIAVAAIVAVAVLEMTDTVDLGGFFETQVNEIKSWGF